MSLDRNDEAAAADLEQRLQKLKEDNDVLRAMLRRAMGDAVTKQQSQANKTVARKAASLEKVEAELLQERDRRVRAEANIVELRSQWDAQRLAMEAKLSIANNKTKSVKLEQEKQAHRLREFELVVDTLKKENARLVEEARAMAGCGGCGASSRSGSTSPFPQPNGHGQFSSLTVSQAERLRRDIPSLRSVHAGRLPPNVIRRVFLSTPRSAATREVSPGPSTTPTPNRAWVTIGTRVTWRGLQGVVQYLGRVEGLGDTITWAGLELLVQGSGDHDGEFDGVRYFHTPPRTAVFASLGELLPPKEPPASPVPRRSRSSGTGPLTEQNNTSFVRSETPVHRLQSDLDSVDDEVTDCQLQPTTAAEEVEVAHTEEVVELDSARLPEQATSGPSEPLDEGAPQPIADASATVDDDGMTKGEEHSEQLDQDNHDDDDGGSVQSSHDTIEAVDHRSNIEQIEESQVTSSDHPQHEPEQCEQHSTTETHHDNPVEENYGNSTAAAMPTDDEQEGSGSTVQNNNNIHNDDGSNQGNEDNGNTGAAVIAADHQSNNNNDDDDKQLHQNSNGSDDPITVEKGEDHDGVIVTSHKLQVTETTSVTDEW